MSKKSFSFDVIIRRACLPDVYRHRRSAARQIVRELGVVPLVEQPRPEGSRLPHARIAEWEYSDS